MRQDGIEAVRPEAAGKWPLGYIEGLVAGLFFDRNGYLDLKAWKAREAARLLACLPEPLHILRRLADEATNAASSYGLASDEEVRRLTVDELEKTAHMLREGEPRELWLGIAQLLQPAEMDESG